MKKLLPRIIGFGFNVLVFIAPRLAGRMGFYLFCTPMRPKWKGSQKQFLNSATASSFEYDGNKIQVYRWGTGKKNILFVHGWQSHSFRWRNYIEALDHDEYSIYAFDAPAHGRSGGKYLNLPIYSKVIEKFFEEIHQVETIIGHSLGSFATLYTLHRLPKLKVNSIILTGTPGEVKEFVGYYQHVLGLSQRMINAIRNSFIKEIEHLPEYFSAKRFAESIQIPGLIIHDRQDAEAPYMHAEEINRVWDNSAIIATENLGHNLRSATVVKHVTNFINQHKSDQSHYLTVSKEPLMKV